MLLVLSACLVHLRAIEATLAVDPRCCALRVPAATPLTEVALEQLARSARQLVVSRDTLIAQGDTSDDFLRDRRRQSQRSWTAATTERWRRVTASARSPRSTDAANRSVVCLSQASVLLDQR